MESNKRPPKRPGKHRLLALTLPLLHVLVVKLPPWPNTRVAVWLVSGLSYALLAWLTIPVKPPIHSRDELNHSSWGSTRD